MNGDEERALALHKKLGVDRMLRQNDPVRTIAEVFAAVRAEEREACAKVCETEAVERRRRMDSGDPNWGDSTTQGHKSVTADALAAAIRAAGRRAA